MKLVREHINFQRGLDPKQAMDIGHRVFMKKRIADWFDNHRIDPNTSVDWLFSMTVKEHNLKDLEIAEYLLNDSELQMDRALWFASEEGRMEIVKKILAKEPDVDKGQGLHGACSHGHYDIAKLLIEKGADVNYKSDVVGSVLLCSAHHPKIVKLLLDNKANILNDKINKNNKVVDRALNIPGYPMMIGKDGEGIAIETIRILHKAGAYIKNSDLEYPCEKNFLRVVEELIKLGVDVNYMFGIGLRMACKKNRVEMVRMLVKAGAKRITSTFWGEDPYNLTRNSEIREILKNVKVKEK